ncbi:MAG: hypothetical protein ACOCUT_02330 [bacterium]
MEPIILDGDFILYHKENTNGKSMLCVRKTDDVGHPMDCDENDLEVLQNYLQKGAKFSKLQELKKDLEL